MDKKVLALAALALVAFESGAVTLEEAEEADASFISRDCGEDWKIYDWE